MEKFKTALVSTASLSEEDELLERELQIRRPLSGLRGEMGWVQATIATNSEFMHNPESISLRNRAVRLLKKEEN